MGLETLYVFSQGIDPTGAGLVADFNQRVDSLNIEVGMGRFDAPTVKRVGQQILHSLGLR